MARSMSRSKARSRMSRKSMSKGKRRGGCGQAPLTSMYGGNNVELVPGMQAKQTWAGSLLQGGQVPLSPLELGNDKPAPAPMKGGRSRRFRKSKSMKVFPNNIFRNMF